MHTPKVPRASLRANGQAALLDASPRVGR